MNRRERIMLIVAIMMLGAIVFKYLIHDPKQAEYQTLVAQRDAAAGELARDQQIIARAQQARSEYERLRAYIVTVEEKLPARKDIPALLTAMEQFTTRIGVTLQNIHPGPLTPVAAGQPAPAGAARPGAKLPPYASMQVDLSLQGTFAQTVAYLRELRSFPRLIIVNSISLAPAGLPKLGVAIHAQIYSRMPVQPAAGTR